MMTRARLPRPLRFLASRAQTAQKQGRDFVSRRRIDGRTGGGSGSSCAGVQSASWVEGVLGRREVRGER